MCVCAFVFACVCVCHFTYITAKIFTDLSALQFILLTYIPVCVCLCVCVCVCVCV